MGDGPGIGVEVRVGVAVGKDGAGVAVGAAVGVGRGGGAGSLWLQAARSAARVRAAMVVKAARGRLGVVFTRGILLAFVGQGGVMLMGVGANVGHPCPVCVGHRFGYRGLGASRLPPPRERRGKSGSGGWGRRWDGAPFEFA